MVPQAVLDILTPLVKRFEGCRLTAYQDVAGVWTIGWGHTGKEVVAGLVWDQDKSNEVLLQDLEMHYAQLIANFPLLASATAGRQAALADFVYNLGIENYKHSTLHSAVVVGAWQAVKTQLALWIHAAGKVEPGLVKRRQAEINLIDA